MAQFRSVQLISFIITLSVGIIDLFVPLGISVGIFYLIPLLSLISESKNIIILFTILISTLIFSNLIYFCQEETLDYIFINRLLSVSVVWIVSNLLMRYKRLEYRKKQRNREQKFALEEILFITNHKIRHPIATLVTIVDILDSRDYSVDEKEMVSKLMKEPIEELDVFTKELSNFIVMQHRIKVRPPQM